MKLILAIGDVEMSVKEMLNVLELKERKSFISLYLNPAIDEGYVSMLYPDSPRHPRQKYLLTVKGLAVYNEFKEMKKIKPRAGRYRGKDGRWLEDTPVLRTIFQPSLYPFMFGLQHITIARRP